jgi:hypothetical protein
MFISLVFMNASHFRIPACHASGRQTDRQALFDYSIVQNPKAKYEVQKKAADRGFLTPLTERFPNQLFEDFRKLYELKLFINGNGFNKIYGASKAGHKKDSTLSSHHDITPKENTCLDMPTKLITLPA